MLFRIAAPVAAVVVLLTLPAVAAAADVVRPSSAEQATVVPAGGERTLTLHCPARAVALAAAVTSQGSGVRVRRSVPGTTPDSWRFGLASVAGAPRRVSAVIRCVRLAPLSGISGAELRVSTHREPVIAIPPGATASARVGCGVGWAATGYGLQPGDDADEVRIAAAIPRARGWEFTLENTGANAATSGVSVRCLRRTVSARRRGAATTLRFALTRPRFENSVRAGTTTVAEQCGEHRFAVSTGVSLDPVDEIVLRGSHPAGDRSALWTFRQARGREVVRSFLVCLGRRAQFG